MDLRDQLQQAHVVPLLSAGEANGLPYYTMPFVEGEPLRARLGREGALPIGEAIGILNEVARALAATKGFPTLTVSTMARSRVRTKCTIGVAQMPITMIRRMPTNSIELK